MKGRESGRVKPDMKRPGDYASSRNGSIPSAWYADKLSMRDPGAAGKTRATAMSFYLEPVPKRHFLDPTWEIEHIHRGQFPYEVRIPVNQVKSAMFTCSCPRQRSPRSSSTPRT